MTTGRQQAPWGWFHGPQRQVSTALPVRSGYMQLCSEGQCAPSARLSWHCCSAKAAARLPSHSRKVAPALSTSAALGQVLRYAPRQHAPRAGVQCRQAC